MNRETHEEFIGRLALYRLLQDGEQTIATGKTYPFEQVFQEIRNELENSLKPCGLAENAKPHF